jgi:hypothetical protein
MNRKIPAGKSTYKGLPEIVKPIIDSVVDSLKGKPWYFAGSEIDNFRQLILSSMPQDTQPTPEDFECANFNLGCMVAALIERLGGHPKRCDDANQAAFYSASSRKDHLRAAKQYEKKAGGVKGMQRELVDWANSHRAEIENHVGPLTVRMGEYPGDGPMTMEETLLLWTDRAIEQFEKQGSVDPLMLGLRQDGGGMLFTKDGFRSAGEKNSFKQLVYSQCEDAGLGRIVTILEVWAAPAVSNLKPSLSDQRIEVIFIEVQEGENIIGNFICIERDWQTGKAELLEPERIDSISHPVPEQNYTTNTRSHG